MQGQCQLCLREAVQLTRHHLIPRMRHRNRRIKKQFARQDMQKRILWVCRPCHSHIHQSFTEKELALNYNTREKLMEDNRIIKFVDWIRSRPAGFKPR